MDSAIVISLITLVGVLSSSFLSYTASKKQHDVTVALIEQRLTQLEDKMTVHNNAITRLTKVEVRLENLEQKIDDLDKRK